MSKPDESTDAANNAADTAQAEELAVANTIAEDDPHKVEKLSKLGHAGDEAAEGTE